MEENPLLFPSSSTATLHKLARHGAGYDHRSMDCYHASALHPIPEYYPAHRLGHQQHRESQQGKLGKSSAHLYGYQYSPWYSHGDFRWRNHGQPYEHGAVLAQ